MRNATSPTQARTYAGYSYTCVTCQFPIDGKPTFHLGLAFCCAGCAVSGPCTCSYDDRPSAADLNAAADACNCRTYSFDGNRTPESAGAPEPAGNTVEVKTREPVLAGR